MHLLNLFKNNIRYFTIFSIFFFNCCKSNIDLTKKVGVSSNNLKSFQNTSQETQRNNLSNSANKLSIARNNSLNLKQDDLCDVILLKDGSKIYAKDYEKTENGINYTDCANSKIKYISEPEVFYIHEYTSRSNSLNQNENLTEFKFSNKIRKKDSNISKNFKAKKNITESQKYILKNYLWNLLGFFVPFISFFTILKTIKYLKKYKSEKSSYKILNWLSLFFGIWGIISSVLFTITIIILLFL